MSEVINLIRGIRDLTVRAENAIFYLRKLERSLGTKTELCYNLACICKALEYRN